MKKKYSILKTSQVILKILKKQYTRLHPPPPLLRCFYGCSVSFLVELSRAINFLGSSDGKLIFH